MSQDPDSPYEDEHFEEIGREELITKALNDISENGVREYLGTYGDAIDKRFDRRVMTWTIVAHQRAMISTVVTRLTRRGSFPALPDRGDPVS